MVLFHDHAGYAFLCQVIGGDNAREPASDYYNVRPFRRHLNASQFVLSRLWHNASEVVPHILELGQAGENPARLASLAVVLPLGECDVDLHRVAVADQVKCNPVSDLQIVDVRKQVGPRLHRLAVHAGDDVAATAYPAASGQNHGKVIVFYACQLGRSRLRTP